jgi:hypothetical protein
MPGTSTRQHRLVPNRSDPHMLDRLAMFMTNMDRVLVSCPPERRMEWAMVLKGANITGEMIDQSGGGHGRAGPAASTTPARWWSRPGRWASRPRRQARDGPGHRGQRPPVPRAAPADRGLLVSLEDRGPVFFKQQRQGRNNRLFWIYKFRSMRVAQLDSAGARSASKDDDRITRIGRLIRRTSIDELPS